MNRSGYPSYCVDCQERLTKEEVLGGDRLCKSCIDLRVLRSQKEKEQRRLKEGIPQPVKTTAEVKKEFLDRRAKRQRRVR